ncbi:universal stress protein [Flammeovirgaceae bacterium SG7u.111]|nr:universal stress protein [Flammeovirgaceae bacterium SG7u.132]WPO35038.1 universal stress protein [Flammeovirgaceae bacterium SG7u.111]
MKKILVPIDFSDNSINALEYAVEMSKFLGSEIVLFNSYPIDVAMGMEYSSGAYMQTLNAEVKYDHKLRLEELSSKYTNTFYNNSDRHIEFLTIITEGVAADSIYQMTLDHDFDLIVMGTQGASGLEEVLLGSITAAVIDRVDIPVLAIPEKAKFGGLKKLVYATNFHEDDCKAIDGLSLISEKFNAELTCLHINTSLDKSEDDNQKLDELQHNYKFVPLNKINFKLVHSKGVEKGIIQFLRENDVDMIAVLPEDRGFIESLFHKSTTKKLAFHSEVPLYVAKKV